MKTNICSLILFIFYTNLSIGQQIESVWSAVSTRDVQQKLEGKARISIPSEYRTFTLDKSRLLEILEEAPDEITTSVQHSTVLLKVPLPNGQLKEFRLVNYQMMESGLLQNFPDIRTCYGSSVSTIGDKIRLDWTSVGFRAYLKLGTETVVVEPYARGNSTHYISYYLKDDPATFEPFSCSAVDHFLDEEQPEPTPLLESNSCKFRRYRLAVAAMAEYSNSLGAWGPNSAHRVLSEIVTTINQVNAVMENDLGIRLMLINNTVDLFYYNASTDPYGQSGSVNGTLLTQNRANTTSVIGGANYDIGHLFKRTRGGVARLSSVCGSAKAAGTSGRGNSTNYHIKVVLHEMGHQFGATHTQNNNCNRSSVSSYEPGSGSTLMGYAGVCRPNVQRRADYYYHVKSLKQIKAYLSARGGNCAYQLPNPNTAPTVEAGRDYTIPMSTPFVLTGSFFDAEDPLGQMSFCWEQYDKDVAPMPPLPTSTVGPTFRSMKPKKSIQRYFPSLGKIVNNDYNATWEPLPVVSRTMKFRLTGRDNSSNRAGCTADDNMRVVVDGNVGPFRVQHPSSLGISWAAGSSELVHWDVAGTNGGQVNCSHVDILLSYDGGFTYLDTLAKNVPNNGTASVIAPSRLTNSARVMVICSDNIFFDISNHNFEIKQSMVFPIDLLDFTVKVTEKQQVQVKWSTATEEENSHFTIERSRDALVWEPIGQIAGKGTTTTISAYQWIDEYPYTGYSYYRLKQTDVDKKHSYSNIESVQLDTKKQHVVVYPNPVLDKTTLRGSKGKLGTFKLYNALGENVIGKVVVMHTNEEMLVLDMSKLASGVYYLQTSTSTHKIYKQ